MTVQRARLGLIAGIAVVFLTGGFVACRPASGDGTPRADATSSCAAATTGCEPSSSGGPGPTGSPNSVEPTPTPGSATPTGSVPPAPTAATSTRTSTSGGSGGSTATSGSGNVGQQPAFGSCGAFPATPGPNCTGYKPTGVTLHDCASKITAPGTYDSCRFNGTLIIAADNVRVTRSLVQGGHVEGSPSTYNLRAVVLEDVTVVGAGNDGSTAMGNNNYTCRRCDVSGGARGFGLGSNVLIEDSYAHDFWVQPMSQQGSNSIHQTAISTHGGRNVKVIHSTLRCNSDAYGCSSAFSFYSEDSPGISDFLVQNCYITTDAGFGMMFASLTSGKPYGITNTRVVDNIFGPSEFGPVANFPSSQAGNQWSGNRTSSGRIVDPA